MKTNSLRVKFTSKLHAHIHLHIAKRGKNVGLYRDFPQSKPCFGVSTSMNNQESHDMENVIKRIERRILNTTKDTMLLYQTTKKGIVKQYHLHPKELKANEGIMQDNELGKFDTTTTVTKGGLTRI